MKKLANDGDDQAKKILKEEICKISKKGVNKSLEFLMILHAGTTQLDYRYRFTLFDKNKFKYLINIKPKEFEEAISKEKTQLFTERHSRKNFLIELLEKPEYTLEQIDMFIENVLLSKKSFRVDG